VGAAKLPYRGDGRGRPGALALPPARMPAWHRGRPLKRWRYVGVYGPELMLCAGLVRIGGVPQAFWAVWDRAGARLHERTALGPARSRVRLPDGRLRIADRNVEVDLRLDEDTDAVEVVSEHGPTRPAHIWTRKAGAQATGTVRIDGVARALRARALIDDSAGYHARVTEWEWAAGVGEDEAGRAVMWNLVTGVHDAPRGSERTVWIDGAQREVGPVTFAPGLDAVAFSEGGRLRFAAEAVRERHDGLGLVRSDYVQPFGTAAGVLPGTDRRFTGFGVMERHRARW
jgi:hypothetical protein